jgi:hypothetical protein
MKTALVAVLRLSFGRHTSFSAAKTWMDVTNTAMTGAWINASGMGQDLAVPSDNTSPARRIAH